MLKSLMLPMPTFPLHEKNGHQVEVAESAGNGDLSTKEVAVHFEIRGSGWSPPPMGFYLGILTKWPPPQGGVHKILILIRDLP